MDWTLHEIPSTPVQQCIRLCVLPLSPVTSAWPTSPTPRTGSWQPHSQNYLSLSFSRAVFLTERDVDQTVPSNPAAGVRRRPLFPLFNTGLHAPLRDHLRLFEPNTKPKDARQRVEVKVSLEGESDLYASGLSTCRAACALPRTSELVFDYRLPSVPTSIIFWATRGEPDAHSCQPDGGGQLAAAAPCL